MLARLVDAIVQGWRYRCLSARFSRFCSDAQV